MAHAISVDRRRDREICPGPESSNLSARRSCNRIVSNFGSSPRSISGDGFVAAVERVEGQIQQQLGRRRRPRTLPLRAASAGSFSSRASARDRRQSLGEARRDDGAISHRAKLLRSGLVIARWPGRRGVRRDLPLRAVAVTEGRRGVRGDGAFPGDPPEPRQRLPQNLRFIASSCELVRNVLVVAAAADAEVRAGRGDAIGGRLQ